MKRYLNLLRGYSTRLDVASVSGIGLTVLALTLFVSAVLPARGEIERLRARLSSIEGVDAAVPRASSATRDLSRIEQFARNFPNLSEAPGWILKMHEIAAHNGLTLTTGEYRLIKDQEGGMARYQITLPLHGGYAQVRAFLAQVLDEVPAAALDEVMIKRDSIGSRATETRVRLIMYLAGE